MALNCDVCRSIAFRIALASIGLSVGLIASVWFALGYHSFNAASLALVSAVFAAFTLTLHVKYKRLTLRCWSNRLRFISIFGCFGQLVGVTAFVTYISLAIVLGQGLAQVRGENYWVALVWAWMTWKWAFALFWYARKYKREFDREECDALIKDEEGDKDSGETDPSTVPASTDGELVE